jgi:hypothetical protein
MSYRRLIMTYVVQTVAKKQAGAEWWAKSNPEAAKRLGAFVKGLGLVQRRVKKKLDANTVASRAFFADEAAYNQYLAAVANNADFQAREAWSRNAGQTAEVKTAVI